MFVPMWIIWTVVAAIGLPLILLAMPWLFMGLMIIVAAARKVADPEFAAQVEAERVRMAQRK